MVITRGHVANCFETTLEKQAAITRGIGIALQEIEKARKPDDYVVGFNSAEVAGQTLFHVHVHVIPRYRGDVEDPPVRLRHVIPNAAVYEAVSARCRVKQSDAGSDRTSCSVVTRYG